MKAEIDIQIEDWNNPEHQKTLALTFADCSMTFSDKTGKVGDVTASLGGHIRVNVKQGKTDAVVKINAKDMWNMAVKELGRPDLIYTKDDDDG